MLLCQALKIEKKKFVRLYIIHVCKNQTQRKLTIAGGTLIPFFVIATEIELVKLAGENAISNVTAHHPNLIA